MSGIKPYSRILNEEIETNVDVSKQGFANSSPCTPDIFLHPPGEPIFPASSKLRHRKLSFPVSLNSVLLRSNSGEKELATRLSTQASSARRRFSTVSDAVTRKLSTTIGWRYGGVVHHEELVQQAKVLGGKYICAKLKKSGVFHKKMLGLTRLRSLNNLSCDSDVSEIFHYLLMVGAELERMQPKLFYQASRQTCVGSACEKSTRAALLTISRNLLLDDTVVTWGKIVSLFVVAGSLSLDAVQQGHTDAPTALVEVIGLFTERSLTPWLSQRGGWMGLVHHFSPQGDHQEVTLNHPLVIAITIILTLFIFITTFLRLIGDRSTFD